MSATTAKAQQLRSTRSISPEDRAAGGKAARADVPRSSHQGWEVDGERPDPVGLLERQDETRVPELVPIRHGRMSASPFAFFRGGAAIMASDLSLIPNSGLSVQLCGDAHLANFGAFEAPDRSLVFDVNDFDETLPGPFEWDMKRLAASVAVAGRARGFDERQRRSAVQATVQAYREAIRQFAAMRDLDVWYARVNVAQITDWLDARVRRKRMRAFEKGIAKAEHKDSLRALAKLTHEVEGRLRIISDPPLIVPVDELVAQDEERDMDLVLQNLFSDYRKTLANHRRHLAAGYRYVHAARKVVGVGSVGTRAWIVMLLGRDDSDPLFLQAKEADESVLEEFAGKSRVAHHGRRVVEGQLLMQAAGDIFLGWVTAEGVDGLPHDFYVRQLWDGKASVDPNRLDPEEMEAYGGLCGWTLARAHARSGDRIAIGAYLGRGTVFDEAIADFAEAYADQNDRDYARFAEAIESGRLSATTGL